MYIQIPLLHLLPLCTPAPFAPFAPFAPALPHPLCKPLLIEYTSDPIALMQHGAIGAVK
ncbi:hypothetical protein MiSe_23330 [Microseira wollei NIES-4236]|uniref:Uncharacterized protein n=1 Tax=Microseira wollei NIES-4236 TaxID=2530354 RepID=A0AAV3X639_9CYAN|nr:hypothetical protein MiSe_23330 [Microseira wollei NIES-4236]